MTVVLCVPAAKCDPLTAMIMPCLCKAAACCLLPLQLLPVDCFSFLSLCWSRLT